MACQRRSSFSVDDNNQMVDLPDVAMSGHVSVEIRDMAKGLVTDVALIGRGRTMRCFMLLQVGFLSEPLMAHRAHKWTFP